MRVTFERIGRNHEVPDLEIDESTLPVQAEYRLRGQWDAIEVIDRILFAFEGVKFQ